jgi:CRISPR system Cascade subunit CasE
MSAEVWFTRLTLKRDDAAIAPLLQELAPADSGAAMTTGHRLMWSVMPPETRALHDRAAPDRPEGAAFLWREAEPGRKFYLLGPRPTENSPFFRVETKPYAPEFRPGHRLVFDVRLNATVARKGDAHAKGRSRRSDVAMDRMRAEEAAAFDAGVEIPGRAERRLEAAESATAEWLRRVGARDGFAPIALRLEAYHVESLPRRGRHADIGISDVRGALEVIDSRRFLARVLAGFGRSKAFGCGLMLLKRAP